MTKLIIALGLLALMAPSVANAHGGGCRKSSPPGR